MKIHYDVPNFTVPCLVFARFRAQNSSGNPTTLTFIEVFLGPSRKMMGQYLKVSQDRFFFSFFSHSLRTDVVTLLYTYKKKQSLTKWNGVLLEKQLISELVKRFPAFYGIRCFITFFTKARQLFLSCARRIRSTFYHSIYLRRVLIFYSQIRSVIRERFFLQDSQPKSRTHFYSLQYVAYVPPN